jgi:hypothetical protein
VKPDSYGNAEHAHASRTHSADQDGKVQALVSETGKLRISGCNVIKNLGVLRREGQGVVMSILETERASMSQPLIVVAEKYHVWLKLLRK